MKIEQKTVNDILYMSQRVGGCAFCGDIPPYSEDQITQVLGFEPETGAWGDDKTITTWAFLLNGEPVYIYDYKGDKWHIGRPINGKVDLEELEKLFLGATEVHVPKKVLQIDVYEDGHIDIPDEYYCPDCELYNINEDIAHELETLWGGYVDFCVCGADDPE